MAVSSLRIGIETEVLLCALDMQDQCKASIEEFAEGLVQHYNTKVGENPGQINMRMESDEWHASDNPVNLTLWSVVVEASIDPDSDDCKHSVDSYNDYMTISEFLKGASNLHLLSYTTNQEAHGARTYVHISKSSRATLRS